MPREYNKLMLFTGAGFTKNFGGYLGWEMWAKIFNHSRIQSQQRVADLMRSNFDFEAVYAQVVRGSDFTQEEIEAVKVAVRDAYGSLDEIVRHWTFNNDNPTALNTYGLDGKLFGLLNNTGKNGLFFTLNQDLYIERHNGFVTPGVKGFPRGGEVERKAKNSGLNLSLPAASEAETVFHADLESTSGIAYIKLHGSYGWQASDGGDQMVIGHDKVGDIDREPLLKTYFDFFKQQISRGGCKLLVIGYSFADNHVNKALLEAIEQHGLKLYIITPSQPKKLYDSFQKGGHAHSYTGIWQGVAGHFPYSLREIFPPSQADTEQWEEIRRALS